MDARVRYTKKVLKDEFLKILAETPLDKITVTMICNEAHINRATFYKYYKNPADLLLQLEQERLDELHQRITELNSESFIETYLLVLNDIASHKNFYKILFSENGDLEFRDRLFADCYEKSIRAISNYYPNLSPTKQQWIFNFVAEGCNGLLQGWLQNGSNTNVEDLALFTEQMVKGIMHINLV